MTEKFKSGGIGEWSVSSNGADGSKIAPSSRVGSISEYKLKTTEVAVASFRPDGYSSGDCEDGFVMSESGGFAVVDGMGGMGSGDLAALKTTEIIGGSFDRLGEPKDIDDAERKIGEVFKDLIGGATLDARGNTYFDGGMAAGSIGMLFGDEMVVGTCGDTRAFVVSKDGSIISVTKDYSRGNLVSGQLGDAPNEVARVKLKPGDKVVMASDGIFGDWDYQFWADDPEHAGAEPSAPKIGIIAGMSPTEAVDYLVKRSMKSDDKTVIVIDPKIEAKKAKSKPANNTTKVSGAGRAASNAAKANSGNDAQVPRGDDGGVAGGDGDTEEETEERLRLTNEANSQYDYLTSRQWGPENLFDILDLDPDEASEAEVVAAHRRLLDLIHPDKGFVKDSVASQVLNDLYAPWKKKRNDEHNKKVKAAEVAGKPKPKKTSSKAKGSGKKFGGYMATSNIPPRSSGDWTQDYGWGGFDEPFSRGFDESFWAGYGESEQGWGHQEPEPEPENGGFGGETPPPMGRGFGDTTRDFWQKYNADTANARNVRRLTSIFGPSIANLFGDFVGLGDASNVKATISANAAYKVYNAARNNWDGMSRLVRGASAAGLGFLATNAFTGGWHEKGNLFAAAAGATYGAASESNFGKNIGYAARGAYRTVKASKAGDVIKNLPGQLKVEWENASDRARDTARATGVAGLTTLAITSLADGFNHLTAAGSAFAVSGLTYGAFKVKDKWEGADEVTRKKYKRNALVGMGAVAVGVAGIAAYKYGWIPGFGKHSDKLQDVTTKPKSGNSATTLAPKPRGNRTGTTTTLTPTTRPRGTTSTTLAPRSTTPSGGGGSTPATIPRGGNSGGGGNTGSSPAEIALKKAAKAQEIAAKTRAKKLGIRLTDKQAQRLVERRISNLFRGNPKNFERFSHAPARAQQAFTDFDLKQAAAA